MQELFLDLTRAGFWLFLIVITLLLATGDAAEFIYRAF